MIQYIFFDLDGTLTDPALGITNSILYALEKMGKQKPQREELYRFIGPPLVPAFREFLGMTEEEAKTALTLYREYFSTTGLLENSPYTGVERMLDRLQKKGCTLCVATSKPEPFAVRILEHFSLAKYFSIICGASMDESRNTKTKVLEYLLEKVDKISSDSKNTDTLKSIVMVGDRHHDIDGAKDVGIDSIGVLWGYGSQKELESAGADHIAENMDNLVDIIEKL